MHLSLNTKIIASMAAMVFLTAFTCTVVFIVELNNQATDFQNRLNEMQSQMQSSVSPQDVIAKLKTIIDDPKLSPVSQIAQITQTFRTSTSGVNIEKVRQIAVESGWPIPADLGNPQTSNLDVAPPVFHNSLLSIDLNNPTYRSILIASFISTFFAVGLGFLLSRTVIRPLRQFEIATGRVADGNYSLTVGPEGKDDLGRLAGSFNKMSHTLAQIEQKRKDLMADISHEFRTPLSSIQGYTEALRYGLAPETSQREEICDHILREVGHLTRMINIMREWVNNEQILGQLSLQSLEVQPLVQNILERFKSATTTKNIETKFYMAEPDLKVYADESSLTHILSNLVDNAVRYSPEGSTIEVTVTPIHKQKRLNFIIKDTGIGIPAQHLPFVFERFYRVDKSRNRNTGGSGLGLAIVREAVHALGGDVLLESEVEVGTKVSFWLPSEVRPSQNKHTSFNLSKTAPINKPA